MSIFEDAVELLREPTAACVGCIVLTDGLGELRWLSELIGTSGYRTVCSSSDSLALCLQALGDRHVDLVAHHAGSSSGTRAVEAVRAIVGSVRAATPSAGVIVIYDTPVSIDDRLLGTRTWIVTPRTTAPALKAMIEEVRGARGDQQPLARNWPEVPPMVPVAPRHAASDRVLPNFNLKSPSFLPIVAALALRNDTPVYVEISPQEALAFWPHETSGTPRQRVATTFRQVRRDVSMVSEATGADLRLHLDHCDDPETIAVALDLGFNSVMADGSGRSLYANAAFVAETVRRAESYGVPVEGEVGAIDVAGRRKRNTTEPADLEFVLKLVKPPFIGVNVGQHHSCDYGFNRALAAFRALADLDAAHRGEDVLSAFEACRELQRELSSRGLPIAAAESMAIHDLQERLAEDRIDGIDSWIAAKERLEPTIAAVLVEVRARWLERRLAVATKRGLLYDTMIGHGIAGQDRIAGARIDLELLRQLGGEAAAAGVRLVMHGGSSIRRSDLGELGHHGVGRVNFGTRPFRRFLNAVASRQPSGESTLPVTPRDTQRFLVERTGNWRDWLDGIPRELEGLVAELECDYIHALQPNDLKEN